MIKREQCNEEVVLTKLHKVELELLNEFHRICELHHLDYFLDSGTALGAVRHKGFIPWDDDIDVGMLRDDYEKFLEFAPHSIQSGFYLQTHLVDRNYRHMHAKLRKLNTVFPEPGTDNLACRGIFIDIFPFDSVSDVPWISKIEIKIGRYLRSRLTIRKFGSKKNCYKKFLSRVLHLLPISFFEGIFNAFLRCHHNNTNHIVCHFYHMRLNKPFEKKWFVPTKRIIFESAEYRIMGDYDSYLKAMYGDYMQLPPESKRTVHFNGEIQF